MPRTYGPDHRASMTIRLWTLESAYPYYCGFVHAPKQRLPPRTCLRPRRLTDMAPLMRLFMPIRSLTRIWCVCFACRAFSSSRALPGELSSAVRFERSCSLADAFHGFIGRFIASSSSLDIPDVFASPLGLSMSPSVLMRSAGVLGHCTSSRSLVSVQGLAGWLVG